MKNTKSNVRSFATAKLQAKMRNILAIIALVAVIGFSMTACGDSGGGGSVLPAPAVLTAVPASSSEITLNWSAVAGTAGYNIYQSQSPSSGFQLLKTSTTNSTSCSGLQPNTTYYYKVAAFSSDGTEGATSAVASATTLSGSSAGSLAAPTGLTATVSSTTLTISWGAVTGAVSYNLYISDNSTTFTEDPVNTLGLTTVPIPLSELTPVPYTLYFKVAALSISGIEGAMSSVVSATVPAGSGGGGNLPAPTGLTAIAYSSSGIALNWTAVPGATSYKIYNGLSSTAVTNLLGSVNSNTAYNIDLQPNTTVYYKVSAVNANGEGALSSVVSATTLSANTYSLNGVWSCEEYGGMQITVRNNTTGYYTRLVELIPSYTSAVSKGFIILNDQRWRNITNTGNLTFSAQEQLVTSDSNNVATSTSWYNVTFTLSADGQTLTMYNSQNQTGSSIVWTRESTSSGAGFDSIAAMSAWLAAQPANTPYSAYTVKLNVSSLGGNSTATGSAGKAFRDNPTKYVILDLSGSTFTTIADSSFGSGTAGNVCASLVGVVIPNTVTSIGASAFRGTSLASVDMPSSVTSIGGNAFQNCKSLTSITIGSGVTSIGTYAFNGCTALTYATIGNSVTNIGTYAFAGCTALTDVTIPNSVITIEANAFNGCVGLTGITIPNSVTSIGDSAFYGCTSVASITFTDTSKVASIGASAFRNCTSLTSVVIPNSVTSIGERAFQGCTILNSVTIGNGVTSIGNYAFYECASLSSVRFEKAGISLSGTSFTSMGSGATGLVQVYQNGGVGTYTRSGTTWTKSSD